MGFEIAEIARRIDRDARASGKPGANQRVAQLDAVAAFVPVDLGFGELSGERAAAKHVAVMALLVGPGDGLDAEPLQLRVGGEGAREFEPVSAAGCAAEPAPFRLGPAGRADEQPPRRMLGAAEYVADPVDDRIEPSLGIFLDEPMARGDIDLGIGRSVDAGLVAAELGKAFEVSEEAGSVNSRHGRANLSAN